MFSRAGDLKTWSCIIQYDTSGGSAGKESIPAACPMMLSTRRNNGDCVLINPR